MRTLSILIGAFIVFGLTAYAMADVDVTAVIDKTKTKTVTETLDKVKDVLIDVDVDVELTKAAEAEAIVNVTSSGNSVDEEDYTRDSLIQDSINENVGITNVNQASGNMNNQGNVVSLSVDVEVEGGGFAEAQASVDQEDVDIEDAKNSVITENAVRGNAIDTSINDNLGITNVNQSSGNMNNQTNAIALAINLGASVVALSEADLGQTNVNNYVYEFTVTKTDSIVNSINDNHGITNVNQASGNMNNQANVVSFSGIHP